MTRNELIKLLADHFEPDTQIDFLICDYNKPLVAFLDIEHMGKNIDVDDPDNYNRGGIVFTIRKTLID